MRKERCFDPVLFLMMLMLLLVSIFGMGQNCKKTATDSCNLLKFTAKYDEGKVYLTWTTVTNVQKCYFVIEKSCSEDSTSIVCVKKNFLSPFGRPILYSYVDSVSGSEDSTLYCLKAFVIQYDAKENLQKHYDWKIFPDLFRNESKAKILISKIHSK